MRRFKNSISVYLAVGLMIFGLASAADAQRRNDREVRDALRSLSAKVDDFQYGLQYQLRSSSADRQDIDDVDRSLKNLQSKIDEFQRNLDQRRENADDVNAIVTAAKDVDAFLSQNPQNRRVQTDWTGVRDLINRLGANYGVVPDWNRRISNYPDRSRDNSNYPDTNTADPDDNDDSYPSVPGPAVISSGLNGTYQLDVTRSEDIGNIISAAGVSGANRQDLESKVEAPEQLAISIRGTQVTLASSKAAPVSFSADGTEKTEQTNSGTLRLRATLRGDELVIASRGGDTDYTITFVSEDGGRSLKVTRRITTRYLNETVFAESHYTKTDSIAKLGIDPSLGAPDDGQYSSNDPTDRPGTNYPNPSVTPGRTGEFIVPNGTIISGVLENEINTKVSQNNDKFRMTVQSPNEFRGAVVEGHITGVGRSGQVSGRSNVTFNFDRITLRDGRSYDFSGYLQGIKDQNGKVVKIDAEGTAKGDSQTRETAKRGGIGAGLGALIGAIAGGGKGAVIGAILGGGAGAGSVVVQGRDDLQLQKGSVLTVQTSSPIRNQQPIEN